MKERKIMENHFTQTTGKREIRQGITPGGGGGGWSIKKYPVEYLHCALFAETLNADCAFFKKGLL